MSAYTSPLPKSIPPRTVPVRQAQRTLDEMWDEVGVESRASIGNLIALVSAKHLARVEEALAGLQGRYVGRQIICVLDESAPLGRVDVEGSLIAQTGGLYVERLVLRAREEEVLGAVLPLLRPATLNYVWWGADVAPGEALQRRLLEVADKVICDSLTLDIPPGKHYALADLGWARLGPWREALAQVFDHREAAAQLAGLTSLRLTHAGNNALPAWLFAGWVAGTLGWPDLGQAQVNAGHCQRQAGDLCRLELAGSNMQFSLEADANNVVRVAGEWSKPREGCMTQKLHLPTLPLTRGLAALLRDPRPMPAFERAWTLVRGRLGN